MASMRSMLRFAGAGGVGLGGLQRRRSAHCEVLRTDGADWPATSSADRSFSLDAAVRCASKRGPQALRHPIRHDCGDDAFFLAMHSNKTSLTLGIADGVSSWARYGVNPARFAWELMVHCEAAALDKNACHQPISVMSAGYKATIHDARGGNGLIGSSTACIVCFDCDSGRLDVANLGDSGAVLHGKNGRRLLETKEQQHYFNCPYQLACMPRSQEGDQPSSSQTYNAQAGAGDILVLATDGFFDNVWPEELAETLSFMKDSSPSDIARRLLDLAHAASQADKPTPFSTAALPHGIHHEGGKPDDITVIVARVKGPQERG
eukprot:TRINITY_DN94511_c0_g1_i1.p1 TRINITY_DN94511_c0_g1~~TRINITY_DN94511_c0_g1_i1.p1  ORF type:complete len:331 (-),score=62.34 TRINITY_DN94511_c0_g1_i1:70-1029(-)